MKQLLAAALLVFGALTARAEGSSDPLAWLGRITMAGKQLNYSGLVVYHAGERSETSRISHMVVAGDEFEKLETLDGSPREVIRTRDEVRCFLPGQRTLIVDQPLGRRSFPSRLTSSYASLAESYRIRKGEVSRVAGLEAQQIVLEPKDELRFGHVLWADVKSGLLLKAKMVSRSGKSIEQFAFSEINIGAQMEQSEFRSRFDNANGWRVINARGTELAGDSLGWTFRNPLPGYRMTSAVKRSIGPNRGDVTHMVFSDGLAAVSVFVEQVSDDDTSPEGASTSGPVNIFKRRVGRFLVTALGEVPDKALQMLADGAEPVVR
ncbi:MucB/RseB C-terminal domain-containing protein [Cognatazoarcus halotolerans]|uniref:MucB/RseB C-terminal domain-containing protein n=1 Tax=Cognatazoarcus halotolerans TaxID=2686016 RepID=UPI00135950E7|nr:MucB/RseB C-terminal domain-containing protein [Cognatazoarcus halotolerans]MBX3679144.1 MucB/RseB C-terminal domain-containing protein [Rhodocyclaceae bacterium]MCB1898062.1 MucB/RseB C-terminal domain-containing protein [Rhodocyclaceae bacterium]MCP5309246.1 MucB/RseB C-terminal domain-containing protein [Zoogloeaceae bacterium]